MNKSGTDEDLVKVRFVVEDDESDPYVETLWAKPIGQDLYQLDNSPFYAYGVSWQDVVEAKLETVEDAIPSFTSIVRKSGNKTVRICFENRADESSEAKGILDSLVKMGCSYEGANPSYIAVNIPPDVDLADVRNYLTQAAVQWEHADPTYASLFPEGNN